MASSDTIKVRKNTELNFENIFFLLYITRGQFQSVNKTLPVVLYAWVWSAKQSLFQVTVMLQIWIHLIWHLWFLILISNTYLLYTSKFCILNHNQENCKYSNMEIFALWEYFEMKGSQKLTPYTKHINWFSFQWRSICYLQNWIWCQHPKISFIFKSPFLRYTILTFMTITTKTMQTKTKTPTNIHMSRYSLLASCKELIKHISFIKLIVNISFTTLGFSSWN